MKKLHLLFLAFIILGCAPKLKSTIIKSLPPLSQNELIVALEYEDSQTVSGQLVGEVSTKDNGFSVDCGYNQSIKDLKELARQNGANVVKINQVRVPDAWSSCYRLMGKIYKVDNPKLYESKIEWRKDRKLTWADFKGKPQTEAYPNTLAMTYSGFRLETNHKPFKESPIEVSNAFVTQQSWGLDAHRNEYVLQHEQLHFDITEIFTRKLRKTLFDNNITSKHFDRAKEVFDAMFIEYKLFQDRYDNDTQRGEKKDTQEKWKAIVEIELAKYEAYKS